MPGIGDILDEYYGDPREVLRDPNLPRGRIMVDPPPLARPSQGEIRNRYRPSDPFGGNEQVAADLGNNARRHDPKALLNALELIVAAMPAVAARRPSAAAPGSPKARTVYDTHESAPFAASGHLEGFSGLPRDAQEAFARDPRSSWTRGGEDVLYKALQMPHRPSTMAQGFYEGPHGPEYNPVHVARPLVGEEPSPADMANLGATAAFRGLAGAQGAAAYSKPIHGAPDPDSLFFPAEGPMGREELQGLNARLAPKDMFAFDVGEGAIGLPFAPPGSRPPPPDIPGSRPIKGAGDYIDYSDKFNAPNAGKGLATRHMLDYLDKLPPEARQRLSNSPEVAEVIRGLAARDQEMAAQHGLPQRPDLVELRRAMSSPGWDKRVRDLLQAGVPLPVLAGAVYQALGNGQGTDDQKP